MRELSALIAPMSSGLTLARDINEAGQIACLGLPPLFSAFLLTPLLTPAPLPAGDLEADPATLERQTEPAPRDESSVAIDPT